MLVARDEQGSRTYGYRARRDTAYFCPFCGAPVRVRKGSIRIPHFAHVAESACPYYAGESVLHREIKDFLLRYYTRLPSISSVRVEYSAGGVVADVYLETVDGNRVAIECQTSAVDDRELMRKTVAYSRQGIHVLWLLAGSRELDTIIVRLKHTPGGELPHGSNEVENRLQRLYYGRFYYYFKNRIYGLHMEAAPQWVMGSCDGCIREMECGPAERRECGAYRPGFVTRMRKKKSISMRAPRTYLPLCVEQRGGLLLARFGDKRWWG